PPVSWRGIGLDVATFIRSDLAVGLAFGWNVFFDNTTSTIHFKNTDITGNQDRALNVWPTLVNARWFPKISSNRDIQPYIGGDVGGHIIQSHLALRPTAGAGDHHHLRLPPELRRLLPQPVRALFLLFPHQHALS